MDIREEFEFTLPLGYKDKDGVQQGDGSVFSLLWIVIVYMLAWGLFPDVLPAFLINLGFWESSAILLFILLLWLEKPSEYKND